MADPLSRAEVEKIAELARLRLEPAELDAMARQLGDIVGYVALLREVPTDGVEPLAHALPVANAFRDDEPAASLPAAEALANAPKRRDRPGGEGLFSVPAALE